MRLLIHDLEKADVKNHIGSFSEDVMVIDNTKQINNCIGCFGCWIKTPASCVIKDSFMDMGKLIAKSDEIIILSIMYQRFELKNQVLVKRLYSQLVPGIL